MNDFGWALVQLREGKAVTRSGWNGPGQYLRLERSEGHPAVNEGDLVPPERLPYIYIITVQKQLVPWLASQTDMLAQDWRIA